MTEVNQSFQTLVENMARKKYGYIEIQGHEGRDPEKLLLIRTYDSKNAREKEECFELQEFRRAFVIKVAEQHNIEFEELPDREGKTSIQKEFESWLKKIQEKDLDQINHYEKAIEYATELSQGVVKGYWKNEIATATDLLFLRQNAGWSGGKSNVGRNRLAAYMMNRIGHGNRTGQSYTTRRGTHHFLGNYELGDMELMIGTMVGIGMLKEAEENNVYELTSEAFALLKQPKWHERHAKLLSWVSIVAGLISILSLILSIVLMLKELGIVNW